MVAKEWGGKVMGARPATIIVEPRPLVREALESLMVNHSYHVACGVGSTTDIDVAVSVPEGLKLFILSAQSADTAVSEALSIRKLWPDSKIILLFENASPADLQKLLMSQVDGCIPLFASLNTLISTLDLIVTRDLRVMVVGDTKRTAAPSDGETREDPDTPRPINAGHELISATTIAASDAALHDGGGHLAYQLRNSPRLSEREVQILDGLVKGHANKVIARMCDITEATVKVHMKSILRKIRVANRTQAAIWALEHGYSCDPVKDRELKAATSTQNTTSIM